MNDVRVLLTDDNPDDLSIISRLLGQYEPQRFDVTSAGSTSTCLEVLEHDGADLLLLDYAMPSEDGLSFLRRANTLVTMPPVILVTGQSDHRLVAQALRAGVSDCIYKHSMTSQVLGQAVQEALAKSRLDSDLSRYDANVLTSFVQALTDLHPMFQIEEMAEDAVALGEAIGLNAHQLVLLRWATLLHDVGVLGLPQHLFDKDGMLSMEEKQQVRLHPQVGERLVGLLRIGHELAPIIRHHHERWDGNGYGNGLAGEEIPVLARILSVVDSYYAMTSERPYRRALMRYEALERLAMGAGRQWDPWVVGIFVQMMKQSRG